MRKKIREKWMIWNWASKRGAKEKQKNRANISFISSQTSGKNLGSLLFERKKKENFLRAFLILVCPRPWVRKLWGYKSPFSFFFYTSASELDRFSLRKKLSRRGKKKCKSIFETKLFRLHYWATRKK